MVDRANTEREGPVLREAIPIQGMRAIIAHRMHQSLRDMAQLTFHRSLDASNLVRFREDLGRSETATYNDLVLYAVAQVLPAHPVLNATVEGDVISRWSSVNMGLAVALDDGLVVPVIRDADRLSLVELAEERGRLVELAHSGGLRSRHLLGATFTVTNLGQFGVDAFTPIVNPPEVAILGVGRLRPDALLTLSLTVDHRVVDGVPAARFLGDVSRVLEDPTSLDPTPGGGP
jgi:pyruvate dehydrogenase E2 component (dihydrolipoamide acetyltransferase)